MSEKVIGYGLLSLGVIIMLLCSINVVLVFNKKIEPVKLFNYEGVSLDLSSFIPSNGLSDQIKALSGQKAVEPKKSEIISSAMINDTSNLAAHVFLMGFLVGVGYKIASLSIQLLRPIEVKLKAKDGSVIPTINP
jgi:hypothetical protein